MPTFFIEAPTGIKADAKQRMMRELTVAIHEAFKFADTRIFLREYAPENVWVDGEFDVPFRIVAFLEAPELKSLDARTKMIEKILASLADAYQGLADTDQSLVLMNQYPLEDAAWDGKLGSDHSYAVDAITQLNGSA